MGRRIELLAVDVQRFKTALRTRGLNMSSVSREMGFSDSYLNKVTIRSEISKTAAILLERCYNIKPEEYIVRDEKESTQEAVNYDDMYKVVYDAVYKAMKMAIKETMYDIAKSAVRDGMREA